MRFASHAARNACQTTHKTTLLASQHKSMPGRKRDRLPRSSPTNWRARHCKNAFLVKGWGFALTPQETSVSQHTKLLCPPANINLCRGDQRACRGVELRSNRRREPTKYFRFSCEGMGFGEGKHFFSREKKCFPSPRTTPITNKKSRFFAEAAEDNITLRRGRLCRGRRGRRG